MNKSIFEKETIDQADIEALIKNRIEESINLDNNKLFYTMSPFFRFKLHNINTRMILIDL